MISKNLLFDIKKKKKKKKQMIKMFLFSFSFYQISSALLAQFGGGFFIFIFYYLFWWKAQFPKHQIGFEFIQLKSSETQIEIWFVFSLIDK